MIPFNVPPVAGTELSFIEQAIALRKISGDGEFTTLCSQWIQQHTGALRALMATSGTHALEMAAFLCDIQPGDEVILPSFTFSSTANAFILAGARLVFVDIRPDTMNIDETVIEAAITPKTRAICVVHYAGIPCEMDTIMDIAARHNLLVIEDAAQGIMSTYKGNQLGNIGDYGCFSFHETKNYSMGEGGALLIRDNASSVERAEILREKGTDRSKFFRGQVDKYTWREYGSSYLPSELNAAYLWAQLEQAQLIFDDRMSTWNTYNNAFLPLKEAGKVELPFIPEHTTHNAHIYFLKLPDLKQRSEFIAYMKENGAACVFHYIPLHSAPAGKNYGRFCGEDVFTTRESERLVRLPLYYNMAEEDTQHVIDAICRYFV